MTCLGVRGTFTDLVFLDRATGQLRVLKTPSTVHDQSEGILRGIERLSLVPQDLEQVVHGTTVATNTALEGDGARLAAVVTKGHRDVLVVGRGNRMAIYNIKAPPIRPLVPRARCLEVNERLRADGSVLVPLDEEEVAAIGRRLAADGTEAVAVCFLHSYANPEHERRAAEILARHLPKGVIATSSSVLPEYREYERFSTTALNAYVAPRMRGYLEELRHRLQRLGTPASLSIMTSSGGTLPAERVESMPVLSMLSGPAAGVIAASYLGQAAGFPNVITCDMGGTSTDVCLVRSGEFAMTTEGRVAAFPIKIRQIDIHTVGAGGGSIASVASGGFLSVGPRSAKAMPGPACFGRGSVEPTVTDANVVLGRLGTHQLLGGEIQLDRALAATAVGRVAQLVGLTVDAMAEGILRIVVVNMAAAIKEISVLRGIDPRDFALLSFGGAGPLQAAAIAVELGMGTVVIPPMPGNFSAFGLLVADVRRDFVRTKLALVDSLSVAEIHDTLRALRDEGERELEAAGFAPGRRRYVASLDMRYSGQSFELSVPVNPDLADRSTIVGAFESVYRARYGGTTGAAVEIVSYRIAALGLSDKPVLPTLDAKGRTLQGARIDRRPVTFDGVARLTPVFDRERLPPDQPLQGPAIVEETGSSTIVPPGWSAALDGVGCLILRREGERRIMTIDPITLEILTQGLISIVREMRATVCRTASSVAIYDAKDFSCGLFAPDSQVVAQSEDIGSHVVPLPWSVRSAMEKFGEDLAPGDVILSNDPYTGGTHLNDVTVIYPVFEDGRLIFFPAVRAHWADVGGMVPGSMSGKASEIYQEGVRIPPVKIQEAGRFNQAALEILLSNMRVPEERMGDLQASLASCRVAEKRIHEVCGRYGVETLLEAVRLDLDRSEARMRACITALPDGVYRFEDYLETYMGGRFEPLLLPLALTVAGDRMAADFTGASPQVPFPVNSTAAVTAASVFIAVKSIFDPAAPLNQGSFRPIEVNAPPATIVNVQRPAPAGSHGEIRKRVIATMVGALSQVVPDMVAGDLCRTSFHNLIGGYDTRRKREWVHYEWSAGGNGAFRENDGPSAMATIDWGDLVTVQSTEVIETRMPLVVEGSQLAVDSGGAGRTRGGLSMQRSLRVLVPEARYSLLSDGAVVPAFGVLGGLSGVPVGAWIESDGHVEAFDTPGKVAGHEVVEGSSIVIRSAGGGGYGDPVERGPEQVRQDVEEGYVSPSAARVLYGVAFDANGGVDLAATEALRRRLRGMRYALAAVLTEDSYEAGAVSRRRICRLHPKDAAAADLQHDDLVEIDARRAAPLRGWLRLDPTVTPGSLPIDRLGLDILRADIGDRLEIRRIAGETAPHANVAKAAE